MSILLKEFMACKSKIYSRLFFPLLSLNARWLLGLAALSLMVFAIDCVLYSDKASRVLASQSPSFPVAKKDQAAESICSAQLGAAIDQVINRPQFRRARWGVLVQPLSRSSKRYTLYSHEADRYFIPASNAKLLTTAAALLSLGSNYRIRTSVYDAGGGTLRVVGRGDPSLTETQLSDLAQQLKRQGVRNIRELLVEDGYFQGDVVHPTWEWEDIQADYGVSVNSLILNQNAVELRLSPQQSGQPLRLSWSDAIASRQWRIENDSVTAETGTPNSVSVTAVLGQPVLRIQGQLPVDAKPEPFGMAIPDPGKYFLEHLRLALALAGIKVETASVVSKVSTNGDRELAAVESPPLSGLIFETNQESNNLYAEVLLRTLQVSAQTSARARSQTSLTRLDLPKSPFEIPPPQDLRNASICRDNHGGIAPTKRHIWIFCGSPAPLKLSFTHKSSKAVGAKHSGDQFSDLTKIFVSECFALPHDRMISEVEGEAFAQNKIGVTNNIKHECFAPTGFHEMWVKHNPLKRGEPDVTAPLKVRRESDVAALFVFRGKPENAVALISRGTLSEFSPLVKGGWGGSGGLSTDASTSPNSNSAEIGLKQLKTTLTTLGVDPESYVLVDGSGLSRHNLVSPEAIAQTLQLMAQTPQAKVYQASLPIAGMSGSLKNRFRNTAAQGHVYAKTGGMTGVSALSGYLDVPGYQPLVFSILVNQSDQSFMALRQAIDEIVLLLTRLRSC